MSYSDTDSFSDDGNESAGSLVDFIVSDCSEDEYDLSDLDIDPKIAQKAAEDDESEILNQNVEEINNSGTVIDSNGIRRSRRNRKPVERYCDPNFASLMLENETTESISEIFSDTLSETTSTFTNATSGGNNMETSVVGGTTTVCTKQEIESDIDYEEESDSLDSETIDSESDSD